MRKFRLLSFGKDEKLPKRAVVTNFCYFSRKQLKCCPKNPANNFHHFCARDWSAKTALTNCTLPALCHQKLLHSVRVREHCANKKTVAKCNKLQWRMAIFWDDFKVCYEFRRNSLKKNSHFREIMQLSNPPPPTQYCKRAPTT